jgi:hypothetical protein
MEEVARFLLNIAYGGAVTTQLIVPMDRLEELGEQLVRGLRQELAIQDDYNPDDDTWSPHAQPGQYPNREYGDLQDSVSYQIVNNELRLGYKPVPEDAVMHHGHNSSMYGEILKYESGYLGPIDFVNREGRSAIQNIFGVNGYTVEEHPYRMIEV